MGAGQTGSIHRGGRRVCALAAGVALVLAALGAGQPRLAVAEELPVLPAGWATENFTLHDYPEFSSRTLDGQLPLHGAYVNPGNTPYVGSTGVFQYEPPRPRSIYGYEGTHGFYSASFVGNANGGRDNCALSGVYPRTAWRSDGPDPNCYERSYSRTLSTVGFPVQYLVPFTAKTFAGDPLVFHGWTFGGELAAAPSGPCGLGAVGTNPMWRDPYGADPALNDLAFAGKGPAAIGWAQLSSGIPTENGALLYPDGSRKKTAVGMALTVRSLYAPASPDVSAPVVTVSSPHDCEVLEQGAAVPAEFVCEDPSASAAAGYVTEGVTCTGAVPNGTLLDTSTPGLHSLSVTGTDAAGNQRTRTVRYRVVPPPAPQPTATFAAVTPVEEGTSFQLSLSDPAPTTGVQYAFDCGDGAGYGPYGSANSISCATSDDAVRSVAAKISSDGGESEYTDTVTVTNAAPSLAAVSAPVDPVPVDTPVTVSSSFTDAGAADTHRCDLDWGDGSTDVALDPAGTTCTGSHSYAAAGIYTVTVTATDDDGGADSEAYQYVVVYDPSAGFVTGGGWIHSPAGAYTADPGLTGKANFGFVAKYKKGATVPDGSTQFQFDAGGLSFHSTSYEWLVVSGARAQYKGSGTLNGVDSYGFLLTAGDGQRNGGDGADTLRIKIWDRASGDVVYDNQIAESDDSPATDAVEGGSIVIHTGST